MVPSTGAPSVPRLSPGGCRQRPPGATVREQSGPGTSRPRASGRDAPPPHGCPRGHSSFHLSRLSPPFRMQPGSASSPTRLPRSPARHGAGPDPGKSSPIPHPRERPVPAEVDQGLAFHAVQTRNAVSGEHGGGDSCPQRRGAGDREGFSPGACTLLQT